MTVSLGGRDMSGMNTILARSCRKSGGEVGASGRRGAAMSERYFGRFANLSEVREAFEPRQDDNFPSDEEVLFASYDGGSHEGYALVVWQRDGKLYEVNASHCSCYGLDGKWDPEETSLDALRIRDPYGLGADASRAFDQLVGGGQS